MSTRRDRFLSVAAAIVVIAIAAAILGLVLDARNRGRDALVRLQNQQMSQLARAMDARLENTFSALSGIFGAPGYHFTPNDPADRARLETLQNLNTRARSGIVVVDASGTILNGTLLQQAVGSHVDRPGLAAVINAGKPAVIPVANGVTTSLPTLGVVFPVTDPATHAPRAAFIFESDVSVDSSFNQEVRTLGRGRTGEFNFVDSRGVVLASSRSNRLARPYPDTGVLVQRPGFYHRGRDVAAIADVKSARWKAVFTQRQSEFEGGLGERIQNAMLVLVGAAVLTSLLAVVSLQRRLRNAREEQRRLAEINRTSEEFISIVSHELRTPVAGVLGFLQTTIDHWETMPEDARLNAVRRAATNARRLHALTRDVLDTTSLESGNLQFDLEPMDLRRHIEETVDATTDATPGREIVFVGGNDPVWVKADAIRIEQALINLLDNALRNSPVEAPIEVHLTRDDPMVTISVLDRGPGLAPELQERVFERFVRGRSNTVHGTGLGLYICRRIVEAHGGTVAAAPRLGGGAQFTITLPLVTSPVSSTTGH